MGTAKNKLMDLVTGGTGKPYVPPTRIIFTDDESEETIEYKSGDPPKTIRFVDFRKKNKSKQETK